MPNNRYPDRTKGGFISIYYTDRNTLTLRGTPDQAKELISKWKAGVDTVIDLDEFSSIKLEPSKIFAIDFSSSKQW